MSAMKIVTARADKAYNPGDIVTGPIEIVPPINTSGLRPLTRRVLVLRDVVEERTKGGIILPDSEVEKQKWATVNGTLIAAGPLAWAEDRHDAALYGVPHGIPEPGARVKIGKYTGDNHEGADGKLYTIMNDTDVIAAIESEK